MFNRKTLFILGAGTGIDIGLPIGRKLAKDIAERTAIGLEVGRLAGTTGDKDLVLYFFERNDPKENEYAHAFALIHNGVLLANSNRRLPEYS